MLNRPIIDPLHLSPQDESILAHYLQGVSSEQRISHRKQHYRRGGTMFKLKYDIIVREKMKGVWRFYVIDINDIGEGRYGAVFKRLARLHFDPVKPEKLVVQPEHQQFSRLYKKQQHFAENEYINMLQCPHLQTRDYLPGFPNFISMRHFEGDDLYKILEDDMNNKKRLTTRERFEISIQLLRALQDQISDWMMLHRDIKPNNIKYDAMTKQAFIFDLGAGQQVGHYLDRRSNGHSRYSAPEVYTSAEHNRPITYNEYHSHAPTINKSSVKSDLFSMALVISLIWRNNDPLLLKECGGVKNRMNIRTYNKWISYLNLFNGIEADVGEELQRAIFEILCKMTAVKVVDRPSIQESINVFEQYFLDFKLHACKADTTYLRHAHQLGMSCYSEMRRIKRADALSRKISNTEGLAKFIKYGCTIAQAINILSKKYLYKYSTLHHQLKSYVEDYAIPVHGSFEQLCEHLRGLGNDEALRAAIETRLHMLHEDPECLREFLQTADIRCFIKVNDKHELLVEINDLFEKFNFNYVYVVEQLNQIKRDIDQEQAKQNPDKNTLSALQYFVNDLTNFFKSARDKPLTIDWIYRLTEHCSRKYLKTEAALQELAALQQQPADSALFKM